MVTDLLAGTIRTLTGTAVRVANPDVLSGNCVYFANHSSHLDFLLIWAALPSAQRRRTVPIAARDYWGKGRLRPWLAQRLFQALLIDRHPSGVHDNPLKPMLEALEAGKSLIVFPEGTRSETGHMGRFKPGLHHLARHWQEGRFVPVYLDNLTRILPKGEILPVPLLCSVHFGLPVQFDPAESREAFLERALEAVKELAPHAA